MIVQIATGIKSPVFFAQAEYRAIDESDEELRSETWEKRLLLPYFLHIELVFVISSSILSYFRRTCNPRKPSCNGTADEPAAIQAAREPKADGLFMVQRFFDALVRVHSSLNDSGITESLLHGRSAAPSA